MRVGVARWRASSIDPAPTSGSPAARSSTALAALAAARRMWPTWAACASGCGAVEESEGSLYGHARPGIPRARPLEQREDLLGALRRVSGDHAKLVHGQFEAA